MISPMSKFYDVRGLDNLIYKSLCMKLISIVQMPWNKVSSERKSQQIDNKNPIITVALGLEIIVNAHIQILNELNADYTPRNEVNFQQTNHPSNQQRTSYQNESPCLFFFFINWPFAHHANHHTCRLWYVRQVARSGSENGVWKAVGRGRQNMSGRWL